MFRWLNNTGAIRCPRCERAADYGDTEWNSDDPIVRGETHCGECVTRGPSMMPPLSYYGDLSTCSQPISTIPLTFEWEYDILTGRMVTSGHGFEREYDIDPNFGGHLSPRIPVPTPAIQAAQAAQATQATTTPTPERTPMQVFVIRRRDARNIIVDVLTTQRQAEREYGGRSSLDILPYECEHAMDDGTYLTCFMVWLVTVGKGDSTRIVGVFNSKKDAAKVAAPIQGRIRELEAVPKKRQIRNIAVYKSFVSMTDGSSEYSRSQLVDRVSVRRKLYDGEEEILFPQATFRRRYSSSLPHRIEILATSERTAKDIAQQFGRMEDSEISEMLEYNVDYHLLFEDNQWRFDPCLLNQPV